MTGDLLAATLDMDEIVDVLLKLLAFSNCENNTAIYVTKMNNSCSNDSKNIQQGFKTYRVCDLLIKQKNAVM